MHYLRVTEILYPFTGLHHVEKSVVENAAARGTRVHKACEAIVEGFDIWRDPNDEIEGYVDSFRQWWDKGRNVIAMEERFYCDNLKITGQVDLILKEKDGDSIVDIKTSQSASKTWLLQGSAYAYLARKNGYNIKSITFLRLNREGRKPKLHEYQENFALFEKCLEVYRYFWEPKS